MIDVVELDVLAREAFMSRHIAAITGWERSVGTNVSAKERGIFSEEFLKFASWASRCGVRSLPAAGGVVAFYLNDLHSNGALIGDIERAADAIIFTHEQADCYLDVRPIAAALRVIHSPK